MDLFPAPERAKELVDLLPIKIAILDVEARFVWANKTFVDWLGLSWDEVIWQHANKILRRADDSEGLRRAVLEEIIRDGKQRDYAVAVIHPSRGVRTISARLIPHENKSFIYAFMRDITEERNLEQNERHLEEEVRRNHRLLDEMFDLSSDLFCMLDSEGHFITVSPGFEQIAGVGATEVMGSHFLTHIDAEDQTDAKRVLDTAQSGLVTTGSDLR